MELLRASAIVKVINEKSSQPIWMMLNQEEEWRTRETELETRVAEMTEKFKSFTAKNKANELSIRGMKEKF